MVISAEEYIKKVLKEKSIILPSGAEFVIKAISPLDFLDSNIPLNTFHIEESKTKAKIEEKINNSDFKDIYSKVLLSGVNQPKLSKKKQEDCSDGEISIDILFLNMEDINFLVTEILTLSFGGKLTPFLSEKKKSKS